MAKNDKLFVANPTPKTIEVGGVKYPANSVTLITNESEAHAAYLAELIAKGCTISSASLTNGSGNVVTPTIDNASTLAEKGAHLLQQQAARVISAAAETDWTGGGTPAASPTPAERGL